MLSLALAGCANQPARNVAYNPYVSSRLRNFHPTDEQGVTYTTPGVRALLGPSTKVTEHKTIVELEH